MVQGRYSDAVPLYSETLDKQNTENLDRREACFFAERAWCFIQLGNAVAARADVESACERTEDPADPDDAASAHARIAVILNQLGQHERAVAHKEQSINFRRQHVDAQTELLNQLEIALSGLTKAAS